MKRTILTISLCGALILKMTGCGILKNDFDIESKSDTKNSKNDVTMSIKDGTLTNTGATLVLTNNSDKNFVYGNPYKIEIKKDEEWHKINAKLVFTYIALHLQAKESKEIKINWEDGYGKLTSGTYRIIKDIYLEEKSFKFNVVAEFAIE